MRKHGPQRVVALDGPSGSGKSTVARATAVALGWRYVDTGASYRAATLAVLRRGADLHDAAAVVAAVQQARIELSSDPHRPLTRLDGQDVSAELRGAQVTAAVSIVSAIPAVRELLVDLQRKTLGDAGAVVEGRDVGAVVAPAAAVKVYLDARPEVRAARRAADADAGIAAPGDLAAPGWPVSLAVLAADAPRTAAVQADLERRDNLDSSRSASPLRQADDALLLDTSELTPEQVVEALVELVRNAGLA